ncbi:MAG: hypothetical protein V9F04_18075 [Dermatophilaceae bacterium]
MSKPARVLVVCTGNICRSPAGERLLRHLLPRDRGIEVTSAGTYAVVGHPIEPSMARLLTADGVDVSGFAARRLTETLVAATDLVLTMETGHRTAVVHAPPAGPRPDLHPPRIRTPRRGRGRGDEHGIRGHGPRRPLA